jgi:murein DD-endopeptidase MepM/ murein hydrolase activator NlpD
LPPLYARPRHAAPRNHAKVKAALVPAVLVASTGSALGGLAVSASAGTHTQPQAVTAAAAVADPSQIAVDLQAEAAELAAQREEVRASRDRQRGLSKAAALAAAAEAARVAEEQRKAAEAAAAEAARQAAEASRPKYARPGVGRVTSGFGTRWGRLHAGLDIAAGVGSPVMAAADGVVESARNEGGYGRCVRLRHADGTQTVYAHLSAFLVNPGEKVTAGEQIAREGNTGHSTGPHLHFEVRIGGAPVNPATWLRQRGAL